MPETPPFEGFRPEAITFLTDLAANNDRAWFTPRKAEYERLVKVPLQALCVALAERFTARSLPLTADPARRELSWTPPGPGIYRITVLDAEGTAARTELRVR